MRTARARSTGAWVSSSFGSIRPPLYSRGSAVGTRGHRGPPGPLGEMSAGREQVKLLGGQRRPYATAPQREEIAGAGRVDAQTAEVLRVARQCAPALRYQAPGRGGADPRHPQQQLVGRALERHREPLHVGQRPSRLRIVLEGQVAVVPEDQLLHAEAVLADEVLGLVEPPLARGRRGPEAFHRRALPRLGPAEMGLVQPTPPPEPPPDPQGLPIPP